MKQLRVSSIAGGTVAVILIAAVVMAVNSNSADKVTPGSFRSLSICGVDKQSACNVDSIGPGGGTIFFVDYNEIYPEFNYLEVAPSTWAGPLGVDPKVIWCSNLTQKIEKNLTAWGSRAVGLGASNTALMINTCKSGAANMVAKYNAHPITKIRDWYLPTIGCMLLMYYSLQGKAGLVDGEYWSSSGFSNSGAWVQSMGRGYQGTAPKDTLYRVRPVRSF